MTAILREESRKLVRGTLLLSGALALTSVFFLGVFPAVREEAEVLQEAFPDYIVGLLGFEELHTFEGYAAAYIYPLMIILLVGIYIAYLAAGMINADIAERRMDLILSNPVSHESVVLQKFAGLWVPIVGLNVAIYAILLIGALVLDETIDPVLLVFAHLFAVPYLLVCGAIGMILSVFIDREASAQATALGAVFILWLLEGIAEMDETFEPIGLITPSGYYDPTAILVRQEYAWADAGVLLFGAALLVGIAVVRFVRRDI